MRCYLPLYEMTTNDCEVTLHTAIERRLQWMAIIDEDRVTQKQRTLHRRQASRIFEYSKGNHVCPSLEKVGARQAKESQSSHRATFQYGAPKQDIANHYTCRRAMKFFAGGQLDFIKPGICSAIIHAMSGAKYRSGPNHVTATDGLLKFIPNGTEEPTMSAGVVWDQNHAETITVRIGVCSPAQAQN